LADPDYHNQELAEYVFVTFGCYFYLSLHGKGGVFSPVLHEVALQGNMWSMDLLMSVTAMADMVVQENSKAGDTVFHLAAKNSHFDLLEYLFVYGYIPVWIDIHGNRLPGAYNNGKRQFTYYIQHPGKRKLYESFFIDRFETRLKKNAAASLRETDESNSA
jgi:hypothetical protein